MSPFLTPRPIGEGFHVPRTGHPARSRAGRLVILGATIALIAGACSGAATATPVAIPSDATASVAPPASATPAPTPTPIPAATFPLTLTDDEGTAIDLKAMPHKIVSLTPAATEILFAIGAGDRTVGKVDDPSRYPPAADSVPVVATYLGVDVEKIVALGADLVVADHGITPPDAIVQLRRANVPVLVVDAKNVAGVLDDITLVGDAIGAGPAARDLTASMQAGFDQVAAATQGLAKPRTFYEIDATKEIYGPRKDSFIEGMIALAGGTPITADPGASSIPLEKLVTADPEVIVLGDAAYGTTVDGVKKRPGWGVMAAVKTGAIRPADDVVITRPGPRLVEGLIALAIAIHPELAGQFPAGSPVPSSTPVAS